MPVIAATPPLLSLADVPPLKAGGDGDGFAPMLATLLGAGDGVAVGLPVRTVEAGDAVSAGISSPTPASMVALPPPTQAAGIVPSPPPMSGPTEALPPVAASIGTPVPPGGIALPGSVSVITVDPPLLSFAARRPDRVAAAHAPTTVSRAPAVPPVSTPLPSAPSGDDRTVAAPPVPPSHPVPAPGFPARDDRRSADVDGPPPMATAAATPDTAHPDQPGYPSVAPPSAAVMVGPTTVGAAPVAETSGDSVDPAPTKTGAARRRAVLVDAEVGDVAATPRSARRSAVDSAQAMDKSSLALLPDDRGERDPVADRSRQPVDPTAVRSVAAITTLDSVVSIVLPIDPPRPRADEPRPMSVRGEALSPLPPAPAGPPTPFPQFDSTAPGLRGGNATRVPAGDVSAAPAAPRHALTIDAIATATVTDRTAEPIAAAQPFAPPTRQREGVFISSGAAVTTAAPLAVPIAADVPLTVVTAPTAVAPAVVGIIPAAATALSVRAMPPAMTPVTEGARPTDRFEPPSVVSSTQPDRPVALPLPPTTPAPTVILPALQAFGAALHRAVAAERRPAPRIDPQAAAVTTTPPAPAAVVTATPLDTTAPHWPEAMVARIEQLRDAANETSTRIRLHPAALGTIDVAVRREADAVHVQLAAAEPATQALLADAQPRLAELAEARGLRLAPGSGTTADTAAQGQNERRRHDAAPAPARPRAPFPFTDSATADTGARLA